MTAARYTVTRCNGAETLGGPCDAEASTPFPATASEVRSYNIDRHNRGGRGICPTCWKGGQR